MTLAFIEMCLTALKELPGAQQSLVATALLDRLFALDPREQLLVTPFATGPIHDYDLPSCAMARQMVDDLGKALANARRLMQLFKAVLTNLSEMLLLPVLSVLYGMWRCKQLDWATVGHSC